MRCYIFVLWKSKFVLRKYFENIYSLGKNLFYGNIYLLYVNIYLFYVHEYLDYGFPFGNLKKLYYFALSSSGKKQHNGFSNY